MVCCLHYCFRCNYHFYHNYQIIIMYCNVKNVLLLLFSFSSSSYCSCHHYHHSIICRYNYAFYYLWSWTLLVIIIFIIVVIFRLVVNVNIMNITTITDVRWTFLKFKLTTEKRFLSPWWGSNPKPFDDRWATPNIELPRLRWWATVGVRHMCSLCGGYDMFIILLRYNWYLKCESV